jgi:DNA-binding transcriptional ArsR family regulator
LLPLPVLALLAMNTAALRKLAETAEEAAKSLGLEYRMGKVTDIQAIMGFGVMMTPALAVDGVVKVSGKVPRRPWRSSASAQSIICGNVAKNIPLAQPTISQHLKVLKDAGMIRGTGPQDLLLPRSGKIRRLKLLVVSV